MLLQYIYGGKPCEFHVRWTNQDEQSVIFEEVIAALTKRHSSAFSQLLEAAQALDKQTDRLYQLIYIFNDEHHAIPYNPKFRTQIMRVYASLSDEVEELTYCDTTEESRIIHALFLVILEKLKEMVNIYLCDNSYQDKHRYRRRKLEEWAETIDESKMSYEFESVLLQMTDISRMLEQLTETQRRRLVQHIFLGHTFQEIAFQERVSKQSVEESVAAALKKLRTLL